MLKIMFIINDCKNCNRLKDLRLSALLKTLQHHSTIVLRGLRGALNLTIDATESSRQLIQYFTICITESDRNCYFTMLGRRMLDYYLLVVTLEGCRVLQESFSLCIFRMAPVS